MADPTGAVDLRSDTVTRPTPEMREAMFRAVVGDDVYGEDPTVRELEAELAAAFGREAALLFPTGCMANLAAILLHAEPGSEALCESASHCFNYEQASAARIAGVQLVPVDAPDGVLRVEQVERAARPAGNPHLPYTRLVLVENTHNMRGGRIVPVDALERLFVRCRERGWALHLDGARIFNAAAATGTPLDRYGALADTVMCCLSKGLGAPIGSLLVSDRRTIERAHRYRKLLGGGMRQVGVIAAPGLVALRSDWRAMLARDHARALELAAAIQAHPALELIGPVETNIVRFRQAGPGSSGLGELVRALAAQGVLVHAVGEEFVRLVTHRDLPPDAVPRMAAALATALP